MFLLLNKFIITFYITCLFCQIMFEFDEDRIRKLYLEEGLGNQLFEVIGSGLDSILIYQCTINGWIDVAMDELDIQDRFYASQLAQIQSAELDLTRSLTWLMNPNQTNNNEEVGLHYLALKDLAIIYKTWINIDEKDIIVPHNAELINSRFKLTKNRLGVQLAVLNELYSKDEKKRETLFKNLTLHGIKPCYLEKVVAEYGLEVV